MNVIVILVSLNIFLALLVFSFLLQTIVFMLGTLKKPRLPPQRDTVFVKKPLVTIQLPIFNEGKLVEELVESVTKMNYPKNKIEIQLLDDSTDDTLNISQKLVKEYKDNGLKIELLHRKSREGYKAGALNNGLERARGDFIMILDADFAPSKNFLEKTLPYFSNEKIAFVKTSVHISNTDTILTRTFSSMVAISTQIEQVGRDRLSIYQPVSGSSFIIRKSAISSVGGWSPDTLVEDEDLSFALYLKGWKNAYISDISSSCKAPETLKGLRIQQFRWAKGATQCLFKYWKDILTNKKTSFFQKIMALYGGYKYIAFLLFAFSSLTGGMVSLLFLLNPTAMPHFFYIFTAISTPMFAFFPITTFMLFVKNGFSIRDSFFHLLYTTLFFYIVAIPVIRGVLSALRKDKSAFIPTPK